MQAGGKSEKFVDRLAIDLATERFLHSPMPDLVERVRSELVAIRDVLVEAFPDSAIVLTGSMSVGEGQVDLRSGHPVILSDYDLFVVSRNLRCLWPLAARQRLLSALDVMPLSARLDISLVWQPLLRKKMTTISGAVIGGTLDISETIPFITAPPAGCALLRAYQFLTAAPLYPEQYEWLCAKSLMRGAYALLLSEAKGRPYREWIRLSSLAFVRDAIQSAETQLGADAVNSIRRACDAILGIQSGVFSMENHSYYAAILGSIADHIPSPFSKTLAIKYAFWLLHDKRLGVPRPSVGIATLRGLRMLAESWRRDGIDHDGIQKADRLARSLCRARFADINVNPMAAYIGIRDLLASLAGFNPHKLYYGPRGISI